MYNFKKKELSMLHLKTTFIRYIGKGSGWSEMVYLFFFLSLVYFLHAFVIKCASLACSFLF